MLQPFLQTPFSDLFQAPTLNGNLTISSPMLLRGHGLISYFFHPLLYLRSAPTKGYLNSLQVTYLPFRDPNELHCDPMLGREENPASTSNGSDRASGSAPSRTPSRMYSSLSGRRTEDIPLEEKGPGLLIVTLHQGGPPLKLMSTEKGTFGVAS
jgi:hypothetical protein